MRPSSNRSPSLAAFDEARLDVLLASFARLRVAVLGDFFLDKYLDVDASLAEPSLETGKTANQVVSVRHSPGAAGTVVNNLAALMDLRGENGAGEDIPYSSGSIAVIGFTGSDGEGFELRQDLAALGVDARHLHLDRTPGRHTPVYLKPRDKDKPGLEGEHSRYDIKNRTVTGQVIESKIVDSVTTFFGQVDAFIVMDQVEDDDFGTTTGKVRSTLNGLLEAAGETGPLIWADSRRRIDKFSRFTRKMNEFELLGIHNPKPGTRVPDERIVSALPEAEAFASAPVFVTAGARGVWIMGVSGPLRVPAVRMEGPIDPTGAGDSFTAGAVLALASGATLFEAALVGILTASVTVRKLGTTGIASPKELRAALRLWKEQQG